MKTKRKIEIDKMMKGVTGEFHENAHHGDQNFGAMYLSMDKKNNDFWASLECDREGFKAMIYSLMDMDRLVAEDILEAAEHYCKKEIEKQEQQRHPLLVEIEKSHAKISAISEKEKLSISDVIKMVVQIVYLIQLIIKMLEYLNDLKNRLIQPIQSRKQLKP